MKFGTSIIIFFLAIIALVAEFVLYMFFGMGVSFLGSTTMVTGIAFFYSSLMVLTAAIGILAPICALIEMIIGKEKLGAYLMISILMLTFLGLLFVNFGYKALVPPTIPDNYTLDEKVESDKETLLDGSIYWIRTQKANVRSGPSLDDPIIATLKRGDKVSGSCIDNKKDKWCTIKYGSGKYGWMHSSLLSKSLVKPSDEKSDIKPKVKKTKKEVIDFQDKQVYMKNIDLYDLEAKYYNSFSSKKTPGVEFKLKNRGNKTLKEVEVTVYFKDSTGTIIAEKSYYPITEFSYSGNNKLKPNYIWQIDNDMFYSADSVPNEWKEGSVSAKITNIEFAK